MRFQSGVCAIVICACAALSAGWPARANETSYGPTVAGSEDRPGEWAVTVYGGFVSDNSFSRLVLTPWDSEVETDIPWLGGSLSRRIATWGPSLSFELEAGAGYRFGSEKTGEFWGVVYARYDGLPWNDIVYTTLAVSSGLNLATRNSDIEKGKSNGGSRLLHYFSPEITFASPEDKNTELVFRLHHRSGVFGLFDGVSSGINTVTFGLRQHF